MSDEQGRSYPYGGDAGDGGARDTSMDTAQFIALNAQYLGNEPAASNGGQSGSSSSLPNPSDTGAPVNPLVAAREATGSARNENAFRAQPSQQLYPLEQPAAAKEINVSFGERRHTGRTVLIVLLVIVIVAVVAAGVFFFLRNQARTQVTSSIESAWTEVTQYDTVLDDLSSALSNEITNGVTDQGVSDAMLNSQGVTNALNEAASTVETNDATSRYLLDTEQNDALNAVNDAISARREIISMGRSMLLNDNALVQASPSLEAVYASIVDANNYINASYQLFGTYSDALNAGGDVSGINLNDCVNADNTAVADIQNAQQSLAQAQQAFAAADFSAISTYLNDALNTYTALAALHASYANGDVDNQPAYWDAYNAAQTQLATSAQALPADAATALSAAYQAIASGYGDQYEEAVSSKQANDAAVTSYLSSQGITVAQTATSSAADDAAAVASSAADAATVTAESDVDAAAQTTEVQATPDAGEQVATDAAQPAAEEQAA